MLATLPQGARIISQPSDSPDAGVDAAPQAAPALPSGAKIISTPDQPAPTLPTGARIISQPPPQPALPTGARIIPPEQLQAEANGHAEISTAPGLDDAGKQAVISKHVATTIPAAPVAAPPAVVTPTPLGPPQPLPPGVTPSMVAPMVPSAQAVNSAAAPPSLTAQAPQPRFLTAENIAATKPQPGDVTYLPNGNLMRVGPDLQWESIDNSQLPPHLAQAADEQAAKQVQQRLSRRRAEQVLNYIHAVPRISETSPEEQNAEVVAQRQFLLQNPIPWDLLSTLDPQTQQSYFHILKETLKPQLPTIGAGESFAQGVERGKGTLAEQGAGAASIMNQMPPLAAPGGMENWQSERQLAKDTEDWRNRPNRAISDPYIEQMRKYAESQQEKHNLPAASAAGKFAGWAGETATTLAPAVAAGAVTGSAGTATVFGTQGAGGQYEAARKWMLANNIDPDTHQGQLIAEALTKGGIDAALALIPGRPSGVKAFAKSGAVLAGMEAGRQVVGNVSRGERFDPGAIGKAFGEGLIFHLLNKAVEKGTHPVRTAQEAAEYVRGGVEKLKQFVGGEAQDGGQIPSEAEQRAAQYQPPVGAKTTAETLPENITKPPAPKTPPPVEGSLPTQKPQGPRFTGRNSQGQTVEGTLVARGQGEAAVQDDNGKLHVVALDQLQRADSSFGKPQQPQAPQPEAKPAQPLAQVPEIQSQQPRATQRTFYSRDDLRRMPVNKLRQQAEEWGVDFDTRSMTVPRILDAQRPENLSDGELYWVVKNAGKSAGSRQQNIETMRGLVDEGLKQGRFSINTAKVEKAAGKPDVFDQVQPEKSNALGEPSAGKMGQLPGGDQGHGAGEGERVQRGQQGPPLAAPNEERSSAEAKEPVAKAPSIFDARVKEPWQMTRREFRQQAQWFHGSPRKAGQAIEREGPKPGTGYQTGEAPQRNPNEVGQSFAGEKAIAARYAITPQNAAPTTGEPHKGPSRQGYITPLALRPGAVEGRDYSFSDEHGGKRTLNILTPNAVETHTQSVARALDDGKPVPPEVLKDYPDLQKQAGQKGPSNEPTPIGQRPEIRGDRGQGQGVGSGQPQRGGGVGGNQEVRQIENGGHGAEGPQEEGQAQKLAAEKPSVFDAGDVEPSAFPPDSPEARAGFITLPESKLRGLEVVQGRISGKRGEYPRILRINGKDYIVMSRDESGLTTLIPASKADYAPPTVLEKPTAAVESKPAEERRIIGKNIDGQDVYEDARGVRSIVENGVRSTESVRVIPTKEGVATHVDVAQRPVRFKTAEEREAGTKKGIAEKAITPKGTSPESTTADQLGKLIDDPNIQKIKGSEVAKLYRDEVRSRDPNRQVTMKDVQDAQEFGVNRWILNNKEIDPTLPLDKAKANVAALEKMLDKVPTQGWRSEEAERFQQFSTPPHYAYAAAWVANIKPTDTLLEPSAGTGSLAVYGMKATDHTVANELSPRRAEILKELGVPEIHQENAEQISKIMAGKVEPTVVVMNPPFSQTAGRMGDKKVPMTAAKHIEEALSLLPNGGRLVVIVGRGMSPDAPTFRNWWKRIGEQYDVRANVGVDGDVYRKYGTSFGTRTLVIDKNAPSGREIVTGDVPGVLELMERLAGVRDERTTPTQSTGDQSGLQTEAGAGRGNTQPQRPVSPATGTVGSGAGQVSVRAKPGVSSRAEAGGHDAGAAEAGDGGVVSEPATAVRRGTVAGETEPAPSGPERAGRSVAGSEPQVEAATVGEAAAPKSKGKLTDAVFEGYQPQRISVKGAQPHPSELVESAAMASVLPPKADYRPRIPQKIIQSGKLSAAQLEPVIYAGQAHQEMLPEITDKQGNKAQYRRGYFVGDGTGVGKGAIAAGIFTDNLNQGRTKGVWISKNFKLYHDAMRDWKWLEQDPKHLLRHDKFKLGTPITAEKGILYSAYGTLKTELDNPKSRVKQMVDWLGKDFDGVIVFDESHMMKSAQTEKGSRGTKEASQTAMAGLQLQQMLPKARVVYLSATGATEVGNLAYAPRLGLWGPGTPFTDAADFTNKVSAGGVAAMELIARDLKQTGSYLARQLSFRGVQQEKLTHPLTPEQRVVYDKLAESWQVVLRNINKALEATAGVPRADGSVKVDGRAKGKAMSAFWGAHQRFFNQIITSLQMPTVLKDVEAETKAGKAAVLQLVNTNEAAQERALARLSGKVDPRAARTTADDIELEDLDITPRDQLLQLVQHSFPVQQYEQFKDDQGNVKMRPVTDSKGNPVENPQAVRMREKLLGEIASIKVPEGPLEMLLNHFGADQVAEVTGRTRRVVRVKKEGGEVTEVQPWSESRALADASAFQSGKKNILVFSNAGGTGASYHADAKVANQKQRVHYLIQPGWVAENAVQGFGRTHRSGEVNQPLYKLVQTDLNGQKRFISTIARRLDQLGALTRGQRQAGSQGMFSELDNLESSHARDALRNLITDMDRDKIPGMDISDFEEQTGLKVRKDDKSGLKLETPPIPQFLNRLLSMKIDAQNKLFDTFMDYFEHSLETAKATGELDTGLETLRADSIAKKNENIVYTDPRTGAETKHVELEVKNKTKPNQFASVASRPDVFFAKNERSGKIYGFTPGGNRTDSNTGAVVETYRRIGPDHNDAIPRYEIDAGEHWNRVESQKEAQALWDKQLAAVPTHKTDDLHLLTGAILPIWDKVGGKPQVRRLQTDSGERLLGRIIPEEELSRTLENLGVKTEAPKLSGADAYQRVLERGDKLHLADDWSIQRHRVAGENRVEVVGPNYSHWDRLAQMGAQLEKQGYQNRVFIPSGPEGADVMQKVMEMRPLQRISRGNGRSGMAINPAYAAQVAGKAAAEAGKTSLAEARHVRERYSVIAQKDSPHLAQAFTLAQQPGKQSESMIRSFVRKSFGDDKAALQDFLKLGYEYRGEIFDKQGQPASGLPRLTDTEQQKIEADPKIQKAIATWNREVAPMIQDIRSRNSLPMSSKAGGVPLFLNLASEYDPTSIDRANVNLGKAFSKQASGEGSYLEDPEEALNAIVRGHLRTDAAGRLRDAIRAISIDRATVKDPTGSRNPAEFQAPKSGHYFEADYKGHKEEVAVVDLNKDKFGEPKWITDEDGNKVPYWPPELHYVPKRVAEAFDQLRQSTDPTDTLVDKVMHGLTRASLIGDFSPHSLRVLLTVGSRMGQSGQSLLSGIKWFGSIPATIYRMQQMAKTPLGEAMQMLVDRSGSNRGAGYGLKEPGNKFTKAANIPHQMLMGPEAGVDPMARRVVADAHLRMELGNRFMDGIEADLKSGSVAPYEAAKRIEQKISAKGMLALGRRVNATLGFSNRQTRSNLLNNMQRWLPFLSSQSGMIPNELRWLTTLNLDPKSIAKNIGRGDYKTALIQAATQIASGPVGTYLMMQGLNYAMTAMQNNGQGRFMDDNDEGHKLDVQIAPGWYISNLDPMFSRASRLMGIRAKANKKTGVVGSEIGRESINEMATTLNPALRMGFTAASGDTPYIVEGNKLMAAREGWWWPAGFGRQTAQSITSGKGALPGLAQDATSALTGLRIAPSSGKNYTDAERLAHQVLQKDVSGREMSPEDRARRDARRELVRQLRQNPEKKGMLTQAVKDGIIPSSEIKEVQREAQRPELVNLLKTMEPEEAAKVYEAASASEKNTIRDAVMEKTIRSQRLPAEDQDKLLSKLGIEPPIDLSLNRELHGLNQKMNDWSKAKAEVASLLRQGKNKDARDLLLSAHPSPQEAARQKQLEAYHQTIEKLRKLMDEGTYDRTKGEATIRKLVENAATKKKAA